MRPAPRAGAWQPVSAEIGSVLRRSMGPRRPIYSSGEVSVFVVLVGVLAMERWRAEQATKQQREKHRSDDVTKRQICATLGWT